MIGMKNVVEMIKEKNPNVPIILGGGPLSLEVVERYGADGYAKTAGTAVDEALRLLKMLKEEDLK